jgi:hypothetical protein
MRQAANGLARPVAYGLSERQAVRTLLFVPGDLPDRFDKAIAAGAGLAVLD